MSRRTSIIKALTEKLKLINGQGIYKTNLYQNAYAKLKFWDEVNDFPSVYLTPGSEQREYHPGDFAWGYLMVCVKVLVWVKSWVRVQVWTTIRLKVRVMFGLGLTSGFE